MVHGFVVTLDGVEKGVFRTKFDALMFIANWKGTEVLTDFDIEEVGSSEV